jgi:hypothetical protein
MEIQMTDFENAAFSVFMVLLTRAIISFDLNFYMPISLVSTLSWILYGNLEGKREGNG